MDKGKGVFLINCEKNYGGGFENVFGVKILGNLLAKLRKFLNDCGFYFADSEHSDELSNVNVYTYLFNGNIKTLFEKLRVLYRNKANENKMAFEKFCEDDKAFIMYADKDTLETIKKQNEQKLERNFEFENKSELVK